MPWAESPTVRPRDQGSKHVMEGSLAVVGPHRKTMNKSHLILVTTSIKPPLREKQRDRKKKKMWRFPSHLLGQRGEARGPETGPLPAGLRAPIAFTRPFSSGFDWAEGRGLPTWKVVSSMARDTLHFLTTLWKKYVFSSLYLTRQMPLFTHFY